MQSKIKVICCGIGALGAEIVRLITEKESEIEIVGAVDISDHLIGEDLGKATGIGKSLDIAITKSLSETCETVEADVVLYTAEGIFSKMFDSVKIALQSGKNVISSGDQAGFPWTKSPELALEADEIAKMKNVTFLGTGINPGFMMDYLPITLTGIMKQVDKITIKRIADTSTCGELYWNKCGFGKSLDEFNDQLAKGSIAGPVHLREEMEMTAKALGWGDIEYREEKKGLVSKSRRKALSGVVEPGTICGVEQSSYGILNGKEVITYIYNIVIHPKEDGMATGNYISISGNPGVECSVTGEQATQSWSTTAAIVVNSIPQVIKAPPGLLSVYELPPSPCLK